MKCIVQINLDYDVPANEQDPLESIDDALEHATHLITLGHKEFNFEKSGVYGSFTVLVQDGDEGGEHALRPGQQTSLAHFMHYVVEIDQDDLDAEKHISRFTSGPFTVSWSSLYSSDGHVVSEEFDLFCEEQKLDAHEQMDGTMLNKGGVLRLAAIIAPGQPPEAIIGTVS
jgi:hypothetical protein